MPSTTTPTPSPSVTPSPSPSPTTTTSSLPTTAPTTAPTMTTSSPVVTSTSTAHAPSAGPAHTVATLTSSPAAPHYTRPLSPRVLTTVPSHVAHSADPTSALMVPVAPRTPSPPPDEHGLAYVVVHPPQPLLPHVPASVLPASWLGVAIGFALVLNGIFIVYLVALLVPFLRRRPRPAGDAHRFSWHFLIPCRDEEAVIADTLHYLTRTFPTAHVWVIDDDSDDGTAVIIQQHIAQSRRVHLVQRRRPQARTGKSDALNAAYRTLGAWLPDEADRSRVVLCVVDADGRPAAGCLDVVAADHLFGRAETAAVQIEVRMINRDDPLPVPDRGPISNHLGRLLVRLQDIEFRAVVSAVQLSRRWMHTVAMGGNGQFMRMSVLDQIAGDQERPWRGSLQEDFEVGMHVLLAGGRTEFTPDTWVDQEALARLGPLLAQRTRWSQGMMQCIRYLRRVWASPHVSSGGVLELTYCLIQPWVQLAATILFPVPWLVLGLHYLRQPELAGQFGADGGWTLLLLYVTAALGQLTVWGLAYRQVCEPAVGFWRAVGYGAAFSILAYISYVATWRAFGRILRRRNGWAKTRRNAELAAGPVVVEA